MTKTIFKTLLSLLILFSISCGDRPTGSDGGGIIGDNKETPQTETQPSKDFLNNFNSLAPSYTGKIEEVYDSEWNRKEYIFEANADMTVEGTKYTFWGMAPDNKEYAYYYMESGEGQKSYFPYDYALAFKNGTIAEESAHYGSELNKKMQAAMLEVDTSEKTYYDHSKINPTQTTSPEANNWKNQVAGKTMTAYYNGDNSASFVFDNNGNLKITYQRDEYDYNTMKPTGNKVTETENLTFWGARNGGILYGLYYTENKNGYNGSSYYGKCYSISGNSLQESGFSTEYEQLMHPIDTSTHYDNTKLKTPQTTSPEANNWKSQVANKTFTSKSMTTYNYTFELGGNIKETTGSGQYERTETYYFWGALDNNRVVYYKKHNARDYFGEDYQGEDKEFWEYCGFSFDKNNLTEFKKYELSEAYWKSFYNWSRSQNQNNINWSSYPLPTTKDIDWNQPTTGTLTTK